MKNLHIPLTVNNGSGNSFYIIDDDEIYATNNNIITLFATPSGKRIRNAEFGIIAYFYLNESKTTDTIRIIRQDITDKFKKYIKNATLDNIQVKLNDDSTFLLSGQ
jgi:hypothetical protein